MTKFSTLLAAGGVMGATSLLGSAPISLAQNAPKEAPTEAVTEFMTNYNPTECTVQFGYVETVRLPEQLARNFERTMDKVMVSQPVANCDATTGTDNGETRNFNFINAENGFYKVITESTAVYDEEISAYVFKVLGVRFIPIDTDGELDVSNATTMRSIASGICEANELDDPHNVFCEFAAMGNDGSKLAVGQLSYFY